MNQSARKGLAKTLRENKVQQFNIISATRRYIPISKS